MAVLNRITKRGGRRVELHDGALGVGSAGTDHEKVRIEFRGALDSAHAYVGLLSTQDVVRIASTAVKASALAQHLSTAEAAQWLDLTRRVLAKSCASKG